MRWIPLAGFLPFAWRRLLTYLHIYQQEEYQPVRFLRWMALSHSYDRRVSLLILIIGILESFRVLRLSVATAAVGAVLLAFTLLEKDPRKSSKKPLVVTARARRILWTAAGLIAAVAIAAAALGFPALLWIIVVQLIPFALAGGNLLLTPYERAVQQRFWNEAHGKLESLKPTVVGITGSFGKTSTKHLLGQVLEMQAATLITPGSVNTPMGISRVVREQLGAHHRFFVCEMGAYGPGSIERLCRLAPPDMAVITAIGMAHYERFKSLETVARTKFELAEAAVARGGTVIIAEQVLEFEYARSFRERYRNSVIVAGKSFDCELRLVATTQTASGISAQVVWRNLTYDLRAPIFGEHHISNMAIAFAAACALGVSPEDAIVALAATPQIKHLLEVKDGPSGARLIDDAYNSNPVGFASGLRLLSDLRVDGGRRILITPGMVELGPAHEAEHQKIGQLAAEHVDVLVPVLPERIKSLTESYAKARPDALVVPCPDFAAAQDWMTRYVKPADVVLIENDLPDLYEKKLKL